ncbi:MULTISPECIES: hypothetical protein [unclassified Citrobacter]|uniref:hypothetical protein n=1 Tax=unclassified Citrobacter TaxID=2644389 RepID=UPI0002DBBD10|nr:MULTISPECIES: hypothetical protein [unclassified Citrobacter]MBA7795330.1 hypothetical protein [Citrobacter sp. RHBSTW-01065]MBA7876999.1 hypothetical protein [Citrobacter sp. RHBSTW-00827]MBA7937959.1 hypothetical protein [Citrobacter sp. RHBSTW-00509]MDM3322750.1 hypothetical protein [Citrobacter sp. Cb080]QLT53441.1 hypothetical protein HV285_08750 [Citrobacter sp. RHBSTW-00821]
MEFQSGYCTGRRSARNSNLIEGIFSKTALLDGSNSKSGRQPGAIAGQISVAPGN